MLYCKKDTNNIRQIILPKTISLEDKDAFFSLIFDFINSEIKTLELEFQETETIDSAGLGFLLIASQYCNDSKKKLVLKNPKGSCRQIFEIMSFRNLFTIKYDLEHMLVQQPNSVVFH
jgi:anti-anti-sigma factor